MLFENKAARGIAERLNIESVAVLEIPRSTNSVHAAKKTAHLLALLRCVEVRPAAAAAWIYGEQVTADSGPDGQHDGAVVLDLLEDAVGVERQLPHSLVA